jgi:circadian clock protein KaiC
MMVTTGVDGLDQVLEGGFSRPSVVLVAGVAGSGKTTFVMQSLFNAAKSEEETCLFMPAVGEPLAMINNFMSKFSFYDPALYEQGRIHFFDISDISLRETPEEIIDSIGERIEAVRPTRVAIDPVTTLGYRLDRKERREFFYNLFTHIKGWNALFLVTGEFTPEDLSRSVISYMVDGIIYLSEEEERQRTTRHIAVKKMRGQKYITGRHSLEITSDGIRVYPRLAVTVKPEVVPEGRCSTGIEGLDKMLRGGLLRGSSTLVSGPSGAGKSVLCTHFILKGMQEDEPGLMVAFEEMPDEIIRRAKGFGWDLKGFEEKGLLKIMYSPPSEVNPDEYALLIRDAIQEIGAKRVTIDALNGFREVLPNDGALRRYVSSLTSLFKSKGITCIFTHEIPEITGKLTVTGMGISLFIDTTILMRYVEIESGMKKAISVLKMRNSEHDKEIREFEITSKGIEVKLPFSKYESVLSGSPRKSLEERISEAFKWK